MQQQLLLKKILELPKAKNVKMPNWNRAETRPSDKHFLAWEIYGNPNNGFSETETIIALQELRIAGLVKIEVSNSTTVWWVMVE